jgi:hypothetical protein
VSPPRTKSAAVKKPMPILHSLLHMPKAVDAEDSAAPSSGSSIVVPRLRPVPSPNGDLRRAAAAAAAAVLAAAGADLRPRKRVLALGHRRCVAAARTIEVSGGGGGLGLSAGPPHGGCQYHIAASVAEGSQSVRSNSLLYLTMSTCSSSTRRSQKVVMATGTPIATGCRFAGRHIRDDDVPRRLPHDRHCRLGRRSAPSFDARRACALGRRRHRRSRSPMLCWLGRSQPPGIPCCCGPMLFSRCMFGPRVGKLLANRATSQQPAAQPRRIRQHLVWEGRTLLLRLENTVEITHCGGFNVKSTRTAEVST